MQNIYIVVVLALLLITAGTVFAQKKASSTQAKPAMAEVIIIDAENSTKEIAYGINGDLAHSFEFFPDDSLPDPKDKKFEADGIKIGQTLTIKSWMKNGNIETRTIKLEKTLTPPVRIKVLKNGDVKIDK